MMTDLEKTEAAGLVYPVARRGFVMGSLISGFTLATTVVHAQAITTDTTGLVAGDTKIPVADGELPAYFARPEGDGPFPIILVAEEIFGVHEYIADVCRRLAKLGFMAVAPELYARIADLTKMTDIQAIVSTVISKAPDATVLSDLDASASWAGSHGGNPAKLAIMGFCRGGRATWLYAAHSTQLKAAVAFYGPVLSATSPIQPRTATDVAAEIKCPLLGLYGGKDPSIQPADVMTAEKIAKTSGKPVEITIYPDAGHGFHADYRPSYNQKDAADAWAKAIAWIRKYEA